jgi:hypothetical protein
LKCHHFGRKGKTLLFPVHSRERERERERMKCINAEQPTKPISTLLRLLGAAEEGIGRVRWMLATGPALVYFGVGYRYVVVPLYCWLAH